MKHRTLRARDGQAFTQISQSQLRYIGARNMPARRLASTISPAAAFCNSLRQAIEIKSDDSSTAQREPLSASRSLAPVAHPAASGAACRAA
ncbi:hypothetical protein AK51_21170 [Serratia nematodiphila DZ0503SBS1]|nr:hypothetical protein AK51_21170 [Serratia nematodiphila DZ0503SBS1]